MPSKTLLPSPMEYPDVIRPVTASDLPAILRKFGVADDRLDARIRYEKLTAQIAFITGHEHASDSNGHPYNRAEWTAAFHKCLDHLNHELCLGMDDQLIDILTLCYTVLQEAGRFGGDPLIEARMGENTAVHSLHTLLQGLRIYQPALEKRPELAKQTEFFKAFQMTGLMLACHDLGEMFGEAGSLAQSANAGTTSVKDKTEYERAVFHYGVSLAIQTVIDKTRTEEEFFDIMDGIKDKLNIQNMGVEKSDRQMAAEASDAMNKPVKLTSPRAKKLFGFLSQCWEWIENPMESRYPFLGYLASSCERTQGTAHINRLGHAVSPVSSAHGHKESIETSRLTPGYRLLANGAYVEGPLGWICNAARPDNMMEMTLAGQAVARAYETKANFMRHGPAAFFRDSSIFETRLHSDGSPFTTEEADRRLKEIKTAAGVAAIERKALKNDLSATFNARTPLPRRAMTREEALAIYQKAIETGYRPGLITTGGKTRSVLLMHDLPADLMEDSGTVTPGGKALVKRETIRLLAALPG